MDYQGQGCPAVAATDATDVTVQHIVLDTARLPFTDAVVAAVSTDKRAVQLRMREPASAPHIAHHTSHTGFHNGANNLDF